MAEMSNEYGTALFMLAKENGTENEYADALDAVLALFRENPDYIEFLVSPSIPMKERINAVEQAFGGFVPEHVVSFVQLLCERGRIREFEGAVKEYQKLLDAANHMAVAKVTSPIRLTKEEEQRLKEKLEKLIGRSIVLECAIDKSLMGGIVVEVDGKVMDGSLRHRLHEVKDVMNR